MYRFKEVHQNLDKIEKPNFGSFFSNLLRGENLPFLVPCLIYACQVHTIHVMLLDSLIHSLEQSYLLCLTTH
jgi:hypothetical protein